MKSHHRRFTTVLLSLAVASLATGDETPVMPAQPQASFTQASADFWNLDWQGVDGRTYFIQTSVDLVHWEYQPTMTFGTGLWHTVLGSDSSKYFVRLHYTDNSTATTLQEAKDADFDHDGIPNLYEIQTVGSDPLDAASNGGDSNSNGLSDGWEMFYFGGLGIADPNAVLKPDGLTNKEKSDLGLNPNTDYSAANSPQPARYSYDSGGRLTGVTPPLTSSFSLDEEGNILNAQ